MINLLQMLSGSIKVTNKFAPSDALEIVRLLAKNYYYLKFEELVIIFRNAKLGKYGELFNRLDIITIAGWIGIYEATERADFLENENRAPDKNAENKPYYEKWTPEAKENLNRVINTVAESAKKAKAAAAAAILAPGRHSKKQFEALTAAAEKADDQTIIEALAEYKKHKHQIGIKVFTAELEKRKNNLAKLTDIN